MLGGAADGGLSGTLVELVFQVQLPAGVDDLTGANDFSGRSVAGTEQRLLRERRAGARVDDRVKHAEQPVLAQRFTHPFVLDRFDHFVQRFGKHQPGHSLVGRGDTAGNVRRLNARAGVRRQRLFQQRTDLGQPAAGIADDHDRAHGDELELCRFQRSAEHVLGVEVVRAEQQGGPFGRFGRRHRFALGAAIGRGGAHVFARGDVQRLLVQVAVVANTISTRRLGGVQGFVGVVEQRLVGAATGLGGGDANADRDRPLQHRCRLDGGAHTLGDGQRLVVALTRQQDRELFTAVTGHGVVAPHA